MSVLFRRSLLSLLLVATLLPSLVLAAQEAGPPGDLSARHKGWLEEVALLITPKEREAFLALKKEYQREAFIRRFWEIRDPFPQTARNELQERWEKRAEMARERFGNLADDRAEMMLFNGEPSEVFQSRCQVLVALEIWSFPGNDRIRDAFTLVFIARGGPKGPYQLWYPGDGLSPLLTQDLQVPIHDLARGLAAIAEICPRGEDTASRIAEALDWKRVESAVQLVPKPGDEWLSSFAAYSTDVPEGAETFPARLDLSFPGRFGSRTVVQGLVNVPKEAVKPEKIAEGSQAHYAFIVDGEVLYRGELFEHFRYRFALPESEAAGDKIPVVFQRYLRPGAYSLVLKIEDAGSKRFFREQRDLEVPSVTSAEPAVAQAPAAAPPSEPAAASTASGAVSQHALDEANAAIGTDEQTIRILPPPPGLLTGKVRVEAVTTGEGFAKVSFELDGKPILAKSRPPFSVELNLGNQPESAS